MTDTNSTDLVQAVLIAIEDRLEDPSCLDGLSEAEADLLAAVTAVGVIGNGGHCYWYDGKNAAATLRAATGLDRLGLSAAADAMRSSLAVFPSGRPPEDLLERQEYISANRVSLKRAFQAFDQAVWKADFDEAAAHYIYRCTDELIAANPALAGVLRRT